MNCSSIADYWKRILLINLLRSNDLDIASLQKTFYSHQTNSLYKVTGYIELTIEIEERYRYPS